MSNPPTRLSAEELQAIRERANYERVSTSIWQERQDIAALLADRDALAADLRNAEGWIADVEEREAACCPEDVGFDEYIRHLQAELQEAQAVSCPAILMHGLAANLIHRIMSVEVQCNPPTDVDLRLASIIAELQEAREQIVSYRRKPTTPLLRKIVEIADIGSAKELGDAEERIRAIHGLIVGEAV